MDINVISHYVERVYGFAVKHTFSSEEADELSQEILFTVIRELSKLENEERFEPWLWGIAKNVALTFRRRMGKQRAMFSYGVPEDIPYEEFDDDSEEIYDLLRDKIARLSVIYRDIIILHYYDGLSVKQISEKLNIPVGTVTWRLSEGRKKLKKEWNDMKETALRPIKMNLDIYGSGDFDGKKIPFPNVFINDALSQNILYYCYEEAKTVEDLAKSCGVPAYYIEDRIANLMKREAMLEVSKGKYQTDFIIFSDKHGAYCEENAEKCLMPVMDKIINALNAIAKDAAEIDFHKAGKTEAELFYLYAVLAFEYFQKMYGNISCAPIADKKDGFAWNYIATMETGAHSRLKVCLNRSSNMGSRGTYYHSTYWFGGISYRKMMLDAYINVCEDILALGETQDKENAALAIREEYITKKEDGTLFVAVPAFTKEQKAAFDAIADKYLSPLATEYGEAVKAFVSGYQKLFPKHLYEEALRHCSNMWLHLLDAIVSYMQRENMIERPARGAICDVIVQFK